MSTDNKRGLDEFKHSTLTKEDIEAFLSGANLRFMFLGDPDNLDDNEVFRAGTQDWPTRGVTIKFETVAQWKQAVADIGPEIADGGVYRSYEGKVVVTVVEAYDTENNEAVIVYRDTDQRHFTIPRQQFFRVVNHNGIMMPRFKYIG